MEVALTLVLGRLLKITNRESRFLLPFSERRNCESKNDSFSIHFTILLANDSRVGFRKEAQNSQGIGIAILLESESTQPYWGGRSNSQGPKIALRIRPLDLSLTQSLLLKRENCIYVVWAQKWFFC